MIVSKQSLEEEMHALNSMENFIDSREGVEGIVSDAISGGLSSFAKDAIFNIVKHDIKANRALCYAKLKEIG